MSVEHLEKMADARVARRNQLIGFGLLGLLAAGIVWHAQPSADELAHRRYVAAAKYGTRDDACRAAFDGKLGALERGDIEAYKDWARNSFISCGGLEP